MQRREELRQSACHRLTRAAGLDAFSRKTKVREPSSCQPSQRFLPFVIACRKSRDGNQSRLVPRTASRKAIPLKPYIFQSSGGLLEATISVFNGTAA